MKSFAFLSGVLTDEDLGEFFVTCELIDETESIPYDIYKLLDRKRVGEEYRLSDKGEFTGKGYCYQSEEIVEIYDGKVLISFHHPYEESYGLFRLNFSNIKSTHQ